LAEQGGGDDVDRVRAGMRVMGVHAERRHAGQRREWLGRRVGGVGDSARRGLDRQPFQIGR
jgi:hypothetical protein